MDLTLDREELARAQRQRVAALYLRVSDSRGADFADQILGDPTTPGDPSAAAISPEQRARNIERAQEWGPALAKAVEKSNGDAAVTAAAEETFARVQRAPVVIVHGGFSGGSGVEQVTADNPNAPPVVVLKVRDPGSRDKSSAGMVTTSSHGSGPATTTTDVHVEVDAEVVRRASSGQPADGREAPKPAEGRDESKREAEARPLVPMPESPRANRQREAAERVALMREAARAAQQRSHADRHLG